MSTRPSSSLAPIYKKRAPLVVKPFFTLQDLGQVVPSLLLNQDSFRLDRAVCKCRLQVINPLQSAVESDGATAAFDGCGVVADHLVVSVHQMKTNHLIHTVFRVYGYDVILKIQTLVGDNDSGFLPRRVGEYAQPGTAWLVKHKGVAVGAAELNRQAAVIARTGEVEVHGTSALTGDGGTGGR